MKRFKSGKEGEGIQILPNRFRCGSGEKHRLAALAQRRRKNLELSLIITLSIFILFLQGWKRNERSVKAVREARLSLNVEEIPLTQQRERTPAPQRPSVPLASEDEEIPEDETIEFTTLNLDDIPAPPPPPLANDDDYASIPLFVPYDEPPMPIGGYAAIQKQVVYPQMGLIAGIQGTVLLHVLIGDDGLVKHIKVVQDLEIEAFSEAAIKAVREVKWKPAMQRDRAITVWASVPIVFTLNEET